MNLQELLALSGNGRGFFKFNLRFPVTGIFLVVFAAHFFSGCKQVRFENLSPTWQMILVSEQGFIRGFQLYESTEEVKQKETGRMYESDDDILVYTLSLPKPGDSAILVYYFNPTFKLDMIAATIAFQNLSDIEKEKNSLTVWFDKIYGKHKTESGGLKIWETQSKSVPGKVELTLSADTLDAVRGGIITLEVLGYAQ